MNTFWLKIAGLAAIVLVAIVLIGVLSSRPETESAGEQQTGPKTFYDQVEKDKEEFLAEPQPINEPPEEMVEEPVKQQVQEQSQPADNQPSPEPTKLYFRPLSEIDKVEAERLLNVAVPGRSIGRLPMASGAGVKLMVDTCRQIISKWPDSWYAYRAKQMLGDVPERFRERYKITKEELDISKFTKQRPGTEPFTDTVEEGSP